MISEWPFAEARWSGEKPNLIAKAVVRDNKIFKRNNNTDEAMKGLKDVRHTAMSLASILAPASRSNFTTSAHPRCEASIIAVQSL